MPTSPGVTARPVRSSVGVTDVREAIKTTTISGRVLRYIACAHLAAEIEVRGEDANQDQDRAGDFLPAPTGARAGFFFRRDRSKGYLVKLVIVGSRCGVTYAKHHNRGDDRDEHAVVLEVHFVHDPEE